MIEKHDTPEYTAPTVRSLGTVEEMTERTNKIGSATDAFSGVTGLSGDIVQVP